MGLAVDHGLLSNHKVCQCQSPIDVMRKKQHKRWLCLEMLKKKQRRTSKSLRHGNFYDKYNMPQNKRIIININFPDNLFSCLLLFD